MARSEADIQRRIMLALSDAGCLIWRNNCGAYRDPSGAFVRYGVGNPGGADLIGIAPDGRFLAIECKSPTGRPTAQQVAFIAAVRAQGGIAGICRSAEDAVKLITENK